MADTMSPLTLQMLLASGGAGKQDPALVATLPRLSLAQSMIQSGMNDAPTTKWGALSRLGQTIVGNLMYGNATEGVQDILQQRAKETQAGLSALDGIRTGSQPSTTSLPPPTQVVPTPSSAPTTGGSTPPTVPQEYLPYYQEASTRTGIPVNVLIAQGMQESRMNPNAIGGAGEIGLHQIKPSTAKDPGFGMTGIDPATLSNPRVNINFAADYLKARGGPRVDFSDPHTVDAALKNYNGGGDPNYVQNVRRYMGGAPVVETPVAAPAGPRSSGTQFAGPGVPTSPGFSPVTPMAGAPTQQAPQGPAPGFDANNQPLPAGWVGHTPQPPATGQAPPVASGQAPAYQPSPATQHALDMINRADQIMKMFPNNPQLQEAAKQTVERAKVMLEQGRHLETEAATMQRAHEAELATDRRQRESLAQSERHFSAGTLPAGYQRTAEGGAAPIPGVPIKSGESGPFAGNAMDAQSNNVLLALGPKIKDGTATEQEKGQYSLAYEHLSQGRIMPVPDPTDPTGQRQVLARIPGAVPAQFPNPNGSAAAGGGGGGAPAGGGAPEPIPGTTKAAPPTSEDEKKAAGFAVRMRETGQALNDLEAKGFHTGNLGGSLLEMGGAAGRAMQNPEYQVYQQQMQDWVRAKLRRESGAVIGKDEMADEIKTYFPQPGDSPEKIAAKRRSRELAQLGMEAGGGRARIESPTTPAAPAVPPPPPGFKVIQ